MNIYKVRLESGTIGYIDSLFPPSAVSEIIGHEYWCNMYNELGELEIDEVGIVSEVLE